MKFNCCQTLINYRRDKNARVVCFAQFTLEQEQVDRGRGESKTHDSRVNT